MKGSARARLCPTVLAVVVFVCVLPGATAAPPAAGAYSITVIDVPGTHDTRVYGINDAGDIIGAFCAAVDSRFRCTGGSAFLRTAAGKILPLPRVSAIGINNKGEIVGEVPDTNGGVRISLRSAAGAVTIFNYLPGMSAITVRGINDAGQIVGEVSNGLPRGFIRQPDGTVTTFLIPGNPSLSSPSICCIMSDGTVLGFDLSGAPFLRTAKGAFVLLNVPRSVYVGGMNNAGTLVGDTTFRSQETLWVRSATGSVTTFDLPQDWEAVGPTGINGAGHIVGTFFSSKEGIAGNPRAHSFLAVPR